MRVTDDSFLMAFNAHYEDIELTLPDEDYGDGWAIMIDTAKGEIVEAPGAEDVEAGGKVVLPARSLMVLQRVDQEDE
jgi:glycogen operon protein